MEGPILKRFLCITDAPEPHLQQIELRLRANVRVIVKAVPSQIHFGIVDHPKSHRRILQLRSYFSDLPVKLRRVSSDNPFVRVQVIDRKPGLISCAVDLESDAPPGDFTARLSFRFDIEALPELTVLAVGRNASAAPLLFAPPQIVLPKRENHPRPVKLRVQSRSKKTFKILGAKAPAGIYVSWDVCTWNPAAYDIIVNAHGPLCDLDTNSFLMLYTNLPLQPVLRIPIKPKRIERKKR